MGTERTKKGKVGNPPAATRPVRLAFALAACLVLLMPAMTGCSVNTTGLDKAFGARTLAAGQPHPEIWADPDRWVLIQNPRHKEADDPMGLKEPIYVWAEKDKLPPTVNRAVGGTQVILAPPDIQEKYASDKVPPKEKR